MSLLRDNGCLTLISAVPKEKSVTQVTEIPKASSLFEFNVSPVKGRHNFF